MLAIRSSHLLLALAICIKVTSALRSNRVTEQIIRNNQHLGFAKRAPQDLDALTVDLPIDHFGGTPGTFKNRYWINDTYYEPGGPVFIFDGGESTAESAILPILQEDEGSQSNVMRLAQKYKGLGLLWEHRYYGESVPFPIGTITEDQWQFLTFDQALEDFVVFARNFTLPTNSTAASKLSSPAAIQPPNTPWIFLGASYPGVRAAVLRIRNPEIIYASWASSAPVQAQVDMSSYYEAAERALPRNCSADWVAIRKYVDGGLSGSNATLRNQLQFELVKARLSGPGGNTSQVGDLTPQDVAGEPNDYTASILMDPLDFFQSWGLPSIIPFCDRLETLNFTQNAPAQGVVTAQGLNTAFNSFLVALAEVDYDSLIGNSGEGDISDSYSWYWQFCSEFGYYQVADPSNPVLIETSFFQLADQQKQCETVFNSLYLPKPPNVTAVNKYGGWNMNPSNVLFSNGEFDPWRTLSVGSIESNSPQRNASATVPACGASAQSPSYFGITYPAQVHASDVYISAKDTDASKKPFLDGLALFEQALDVWLPCFGKPTGGQVDSAGAPGLKASSFFATILSLLVLV